MRWPSHEARNHASLLTRWPWPKRPKRLLADRLERLAACTVHLIEGFPQFVIKQQGKPGRCIWPRRSLIG